MNRRRASALLLTLWCVAVLSITVLAVARMVETDVQMQTLQSRRFEARQLALTGVAYGLHPRMKRWDSLLRSKSPDGAELEVRIMSEASRLDINHLLREEGHRTLKELFKIWEVPEEFISTIVDCLSDWVDHDDLTSLNGAEAQDLVDQPQYSIPANRDFRSVDEMEKVKGMDVVAAVKPNWAEYFTVHGGRTVDLQDASIDVMRACGIPIDQAEQIDELRRGPDGIAQTADDLIIKDAREFLRQLGVFNAEAIAARFSANSGPTRIESTAKLGGIDYRIAVIADVGERNRDSTLIDWQEE